MQRQPEILRLLRIIYKKFLVWSVFSPPCSRALIILKLKKYLKLETLNFFLTSVKKRTNCPAIYGFDYTGYQRFFLRVAGIFGVGRRPTLFLTGHCPSTGFLIFEALEPRRAELMSTLQEPITRRSCCSYFENTGPYI